MKIRKRFLVSAIVLAALALGVGAVVVHAEESNQDHAAAVLHDKDGNEVGQATFTEDADRVQVHIEVHDLTPGFHGFHVHTVGICDGSATPVFGTAGGHMSLVAGQVHPHHSGDLPNLLVNDDGSGELTVLTDRFTIGDLFHPGGTSLIVHALPDNFANIPVRYGPITDPTTINGDSGTRVACGIIQLENSGDDSSEIIGASLLQALRTLLDSAKLLTRLALASPSLPF